MNTAPSVSVSSLIPPGYRASGVLLHVTSLPSPYGVGDMGPTARAWIDALAAAGQQWWQFLPLGPTEIGASPYQSPSSFAFNELLISPDDLIADKLLRRDQCVPPEFPLDEVDFERVGAFKRSLLEAAWHTFQTHPGSELAEEFEPFRESQAHWLEDYALFMALKKHHGGGGYWDWPRELVRREPAALSAARRELADEIAKYAFFQFLAFRQWSALRLYAIERGVKFAGDVPIFVSRDSADVWANPEFFLLDENQQPRVVAGVPPDYFSPTGQLWGNPLYDWDALRAHGYRWWIDRLRAVLAQADAVRLDHFRGFAAAWHVPADAETAIHGEWVAGPGAKFFHAVNLALGHLPFVAEDLGMITPDVTELRDEFHLPGMRVLQFAFDGKAENPFLPQNYIPNAVVYTGTHDNDTTRGWYQELSEEAQQQVWRCLERDRVPDDQVAPAFIRIAFESEAALAIVPLQDLLNLGSEARMNLPGEPFGNWGWRYRAEQLTPETLQQLRELSAATGRTR